MTNMCGGALQQICFFQQMHFPQSDYMALRLSFVAVSLTNNEPYVEVALHSYFKTQF